MPELPRFSAEKGREQILNDFIALGTVYERMEKYAPPDPKKPEVSEMHVLVRQFKSAYETAELEGHPVPSARAKMPEVIEKEFPKVFNKTDALLGSLFQTPALQSEFKQKLGQELHSMDDVRKFRQSLLQPFFKAFESKAGAIKENRRLTKDVINQKLQEAIRQATFKQATWPATLEKLKLLPGEHLFWLDQNDQKSLETLLSFAEPPKTFSLLEVDYFDEQLLDLYGAVHDAGAIVKEVGKYHGPRVKALRLEARAAKAKSITAAKETAEKMASIKPVKKFHARAERREGGVSLERAAEIFGQDFLGPEAVQNAFGFEVEAPPIPFSEAELIRAKELGQMLVLRVDKTPDGKPMSLEQINGLLGEKWKQVKIGGVLNTAEGWRDSVKGAERFAGEAVRPGWALTSKDLVSETTDKNYIQQTERLISHLKNELFKDQDLPDVYVQAIQEFEVQKAELTRLMTSDWQECAKRLVELQITQLCRQTDEETIYDLALNYDATGKRLLPNKYSWSGSRSQDGDLVHVGSFDAVGVSGSRWYPLRHDVIPGVLFSRRV